MASRATWRTVPCDPNSRGRWIAHGGRQWGALALDQASAGIVALGVCALVIGAYAALSALVVALWAVRQARSNPAEYPEAAEPSPGEAFFGTVEVRRDGALLGKDEVVVTFVEGWLHVEGRRTAFALSNLDAVEPEPRLIDHLRTGVEDGLVEVCGLGRSKFSHAAPIPSNRVTLTDDVELRFDLRPRRDESRLGRYALFVQSLARWRADAPAVGESVLPPDQPHPSARTKASIDLVGAALGLVIGIGIFLKFGSAGWALAWAVALGAFVYQAVVEVLRQRRLVRR